MASKVCDAGGAAWLWGAALRACRGGRRQCLVSWGGCLGQRAPAVNAAPLPPTAIAGLPSPSPLRRTAIRRLDALAGSCKLVAGLRAQALVGGLRA